MAPWIGPEEKQALCEYLDQGGWLTEFKKTEEFERALARYVGTEHCVITTSGTTALMMATMTLNLTRGAEVIVPNFTMVATPNSVHFTGATPIFADVEHETLCMDIAATEACISERTRAIFLVNANGRYPKCGIEAFQRLAAQQNLILLEDACQALGCRYPDGRHMGTASLVGVFSFSVPKVITTGQGGALVTNDSELAQKLRRLKDFGRTAGGTDFHDTIGYNFKFTDLQAVIGLSQIKKLPARLERKKEIYRRYRRNLADVREVQFFEQDLAHTVPWFIDVCVRDRERLQEHLSAHGIGTRVMYPPLNAQVAYQVPGDYPVSTWVGNSGLWLPSAAQLTDEEVDQVTDCIKSFYLSSAA